jgi:hypothetical protein
MLLCGLVAAVVYKDVGNRRPVLAVAHTVEVGTAIADTDLTVVRVSSDPGVRTVQAGMRSGIIGRIAAVRLMPGTLLSLSELNSGPALPKGSVVIGAVLHPGQYPVGLRVGDRVEIVLAGGTGAGGSPSAVQPSATQTGGGGGTTATSGTVLAVDRTLTANGGVAASLAVPSDVSPELAAAGAAGSLDLVVIGS